MTRPKANKLKTVARVAALVVLMLWCVASVGAVQQQAQPQEPPQKPVAHKKIRHRVSHVVRHKAAVDQGKTAIKHTPEKQSPARLAVVKKPKAAPVAAPAGLSPIALADQTPNLLENGHGRDPFAALIRATDPNAGHANLPPGIAGLQVATLRLEGMVKGPEGMVAVVSNPQDSVYFLHDGDHIYDGVVEKIGIDDVTFRQQSKDAFGRAIDRDVSKRLYPIAGDEQ